MNQQIMLSCFGVFTGFEDDAGNVTTIKSAGSAYLAEGQETHTLKLWTFSWEKYFVFESKKNPGLYLIATKNPSKSADSSKKNDWKIIGNGVLTNDKEYIKLSFDLITLPLYMTVLPRWKGLVNARYETPHLKQVA